MNWTKIGIGAVVGGIVIWLIDFVSHGFLLADAYTRMPIFQVDEAANPVMFLLVSICIAGAAAILFARTRQSWEAGAGGGATYGFFIGLVGIFPFFYHPMVLNGWPYYLSWCWAGITMIDSVVLGAILGVIYPRD